MKILIFKINLTSNRKLRGRAIFSDSFSKGFFTDARKTVQVKKITTPTRDVNDQNVHTKRLSDPLQPVDSYLNNDEHESFK
jgi:hypothetical protein